MYIPKQFEITDKEKIFTFIKKHAFGQLISTVDGRLFCSHIPFLLSTDGKSLLGHVAKNNPQWENIEDQEVLVTFQGPHDYVSPSWYQSPGVPTWNYQAVHIYGKCSPVTETQKLKNIVDELSGVYESAFVKPWKSEYKASLLNAIIGLEIEITEIQCKYKLSQNRSIQDRQQVTEQLCTSGSVQLSQAMKDEF